MNVTGIIAEYNPFHSGHAYHLAQARKLTRADYVIAVMSGDFVQRGEPALVDKYLRTRMALENGADLVLELPVLYATAGGEDFAAGGVAMLDRLGVVTSLCFGSECGDPAHLLSAAEQLNDLSPETEKFIRSALKEGLSYPAAVAKAIRISDDDTVTADLLSSPNNLLGIEYCRALKHFSSGIQPVTIKRLGEYHDMDMNPDQSLASEKDHSDRYVSASALRNCFTTNTVTNALKQLAPCVPESVLHLLESGAGHSLPLFANDFSDALFLRLLSHSPETLAQMLDISEDLAGRIRNIVPEVHSFTHLAETIKCKSYTRLRINRALVHCLLGITDRTMNDAKASGYVHYGRILGFRESARPLLKELHLHASIPLIYQMTQADEQLTPEGKALLSLDTFAAELYRMTAQRKFGSQIPEEYRRRLITI
ncbi:MAG: nucleotidyltransferase family protein [Lachnospiraceae bacterium]|nr:nucleotidyltransferase family protein [Lachnospiraceae bacterium]